jgi:hypothetical protein
MSTAPGQVILKEPERKFLHPRVPVLQGWPTAWQARSQSGTNVPDRDAQQGPRDPKMM